MFENGRPVTTLAAFVGVLLASSCSGSGAPALQQWVAVEVGPKDEIVQPDASVAYSATVTGTANTAVTWSVTPANGGAITAAGVYTAPAATGTFQVVATSVADPHVSGSTQVVVQSGDVYALPADRATAWKPGVTYNGGIPQRTTVCSTVQAGTYGNGTVNATAGIQAAIDACPSGQVVQLSAGTFRVNDYLLVDKSITVRGAGAGATILQKTNGAKMLQEVSPDSQPIFVVGPNRWPKPDSTTSQDLTVDGTKGSFSVTVANGSGFATGQFVLLDELSGAAWQTDPLGRGQVWASPDWRVVWQRHNPAQPGDDPYPDAWSWFSRFDRPTAEMKEIATVSGNIITFTTPLHISYRAARKAQLTRFTGGDVHVKNAGIESLTVVGASDGGIRFESAAYSWAKNVEVTVWSGEGFAIENSFRVEVRDSFVHDAAWSQPGGAGYAISLALGSAEALIENNISIMANKVMVARCAGAGSVVGYNYVDDGFILTAETWIEVGLNASHMAGPHHVLFEGNYGFNFDSDKTHGNSIFHTVFRNWLRGVRKQFVQPMTGHTITDATQTGNGPKRCAGAGAYSYWMSFVGNVLGAQGQMAGWTYDVTGPGGMDTPAIFLLGWDDAGPQPYDPKVSQTAVRDGNWDWLQGRQSWHNAAAVALPSSMYLSSKPAFFGTHPWPWVDPTTGAVAVLPAKARYDAGTSNVVP